MLDWAEEAGVALLLALLDFLLWCFFVTGVALDLVELGGLVGAVPVWAKTAAAVSSVVKINRFIFISPLRGAFNSPYDPILRPRAPNRDNLVKRFHWADLS